MEGISSDEDGVTGEDKTGGVGKSCATDDTSRSGTTSALAEASETGTTSEAGGM